MPENSKTSGLGSFLQDGLTVAFFIGLLLTLQAAAMKEQTQPYQTTAVAVAAIPDITDIMVADNTVQNDDFSLLGLYASRYGSEAEMIELQNIAPAAGD